MMLIQRPAWRRALYCALALLCLGCGPISILAQPVLPALLKAATIEAAYAAVSAGKPEPSGRLRLEFADIALPGPLRIDATSEIPGTVAMVLMSGAPIGWYGSNLAGEAAPRPKATTRPAATPVVIKAWQVPPGAAARLRATFPDLQSRQAFTLLVSAQGKWYVAVREAKVACAPADCFR